LITHINKPFIDAILREGPGAASSARTMNSAVLGWALVVLAVAAGYLSYGWRGVALAVTVTVFWLLLQFSRALRALRDASSRPVGQVPNAVMLNAKLHAGMRLPEVLRHTRSLGRKLCDEPETWAWADAAGDEVHVVLKDGRISAWELRRAGA
jgi:Flp pilus assembly protein TadB